MKKGTQTTLIEDLRQKPDSHARNLLMERAERGDYHDVKSQLPMQKILLHRDLVMAGLDDLAEKVFEGEYDEI